MSPGTKSSLSTPLCGLWGRWKTALRDFWMFLWNMSPKKAACFVFQPTPGIGTDQITLDMTENHTCLGAFATVALQDGRGIRSENPTHSMVVFGHNAEEFVADETSVTTPCSPYGCYGKVYSQGGYVLLIGTNHKQNTFLHCIDEILQIPDRTDDVTRNFTIRRKDGQIISRPLYSLKCSMGDISRQYHKYDMPFRYYGCITDGFIGDAPAQLCDAVKMVKTVELIVKNCNGEDPLKESYIFCRR